MKKCVNTCGDDEPCQKPGDYGTAFLCGRVKFHRHPEKSCNRFPPFVGWRAIEIRAARLLGELLNFRQCNRLARFLRQDTLRFWFRHWARLQRLCFAGIEPDEFTNSTDFDLDSAAAGQGDLKHSVSAGWTRAGALPSWWIACNKSGLIDSGVKVRRSKYRPTARPSHFSQRQMTP